MRAALLPALAAGWLALTGAADDAPRVTRVDPLTVQDDDFERHRDPAEWRGLAVEKVEFREERAAWRLWRITNTRHRKGPLFFVPHDNENAGFEAALVSVRKYGGTIVAVDAGVSPGDDGIRYNRAVDYGKPADPNRNFDSALPGYAHIILEPLAHGAWPIIALHTNQRGFSVADSNCHRDDPPGDGVISIRFCDAFYTPSPSVRRAWPWDDDDTVAFATYLTRDTPSAAFCRDKMVSADFNVVQERVVTSDGSLSNYAVLHGLQYLNFETLDRGLDPAELAKARYRLTAIVDQALALCGKR